MLPLGRRHHLPTGAIQQRATDLLFEPAHLLADGGLGQVDPLTGPGEAAGVDNGDKTAQ